MSKLLMYLLVLGSASQLISGDLLSAVQHRIRYAIKENQPENLRIGKLDEDLLQTPENENSELFSLIQSTKRSTLKYRLREPSNYFRLHESTSELSTKLSIDLEALCPRFCREGLSAAQLNLFVAVWYEERPFSVIHVEVTILDVDDNSPQFPSTLSRPYVLQLKEVIYKAGKQVELPKAIDKDIQPENAEIQYRLQSHLDDSSHALDTFHLVTRNDSRVMLVLQKDLDYERVQQYRFYLVASSPVSEERRPFGYVLGPQSAFHDQLEIQVDVLNINDIEPVFSQSLYTVEIPEDTKIGTTVHVLQATDRDANSTIEYSLENSNDLFQVQADGKVILTNKLDFEKRNKYTFTARASDGEFYALTRLDITVTDVNDEPPEFVTNPPILKVEENQPSQTSVGQLLIVDRDSPEVNGRVTCHEPPTLAGRQPLLFFPETSSALPMPPGISLDGAIIDSSANPEHHVYQRFGLYTRMEFDRESDSNKHRSLIICTDGQDVLTSHTSTTAAIQPRTSTLTIMLTVTDQNDNAPFFEKTHYEAELQENCPVGTKVIQVHANDADSETHAKPQYHLLRNALFTSPFDVESETGWIITSADIDRETQALYQLTVLAIDGHLPRTNHRNGQTNFRGQQHTATTHVQIKILDDNDNAPEFRGPRQFAVEENQAPSKWIGDLQVLDRDEGINRDVEFSMANLQSTAASEEQNKTFRVRSIAPIKLTNNGSLYTTEVLDREVQAHYCFEVAVKDKSPSKPLSSTDTICVRVLDINDNTPKFVNIRGMSQDLNNRTDAKALEDLRDITVSLTFREAPGYCALIAEAEDSDEGRNALLRYTIKFDGDAMKPESVSHTPLDAFMMDTQSGRLMLTRTLSGNEIGAYPLTLVVEDGGIPSLKSEKDIYIIIEDGPPRGNWLFPESERSIASSVSAKDGNNEAHTILVVIGLSGVSAFLAAVLISAILCMIKPCRHSTRRTNTIQADKQARESKYPINLGNAYLERAENNLDDYSLGMINGNGYVGTLDSRGQPRSVLLTTAPIPGLDHLYLPTDKLIGIDNDDPNWHNQSSNATVLGSPVSDRFSPPMPICQYTLTQAADSSWNRTNVHRVFGNPVTHETSVPTGASCTNYCSDCQIMPNNEVGNIVPSTTPVISASTGFGLISPVHILEPHTSLPPMRENIIYPASCGGLSSPFRLGAEHGTFYAGQIHVTNKPISTASMTNGGGKCDRSGSGEEQRSDSGRGASDEEIPNHPNSSIPLVVNKQLRSATLKTFQDNKSHMVSGLVFPSLPRINQATISPPDNILAGFDSGSFDRRQPDSCVGSGEPPTTTVVRFPKANIT
ncbi:hypothetical protein CRM22_010451 [Opisthorchis felineus]|uniref:Cadherin domain-containing protein n=1 Tax=Opisthorchis felineus TaxID=147828 RepID=A0A4S2KYT3_OPIFE|nr:hypothetical protein CRM22_010451 [Opisthorchis felineus]